MPPWSVASGSIDTRPTTHTKSPSAVRRAVRCQAGGRLRTLRGLSPCRRRSPADRGRRSTSCDSRTVSSRGRSVRPRAVSRSVRGLSVLVALAWCLSWQGAQGIEQQPLARLLTDAAGKELALRSAPVVLEAGVGLAVRQAEFVGHEGESFAREEPRTDDPAGRSSFRRRRTGVPRPGESVDEPVPRRGRPCDTHESSRGNIRVWG